MSSERLPDDVVIGAAYGYTPAQVAPFLRSLLATGYAGRVALIVTRTQAAAFRADPLFEAVDLHVVNTLRPRLRSARQGRVSKGLWLPYEAVSWVLMRTLGLIGSRTLPLRRTLIRRCFKPHLARFLEYQEYLADRDFDRVLLSDVRDVVFQRNPSEWMGDPGLAVSIEFDDYTIGTEPTNAAWIRSLYGADGLQRVANRRVSCSGFTWGDRRAIDEYLALMVAEIVVTAFSGPRVGCDQGYHNWLVWTGQLGGIEEHPSLASQVATLSHIALERLDVVDGLLRNRDGSIPGAVHMYDRVAGLRTKLAACRPAEGHLS